jgi:hypothetical protein
MIQTASDAIGNATDEIHSNWKNNDCVMKKMKAIDAMKANRTFISWMFKRIFTAGPR